MNILGIDTTTKVLNLAIVNNGEMVVDCKINKTEKTHSVIILPLLNSILNLTGIELKRIEGIAVSIGPGSFTGLRIGLSTAKGLAFALSIPIIGINSLESYAFEWLILPGILCPLIKARRGEYYFSFYLNKNNNLKQIRDYHCEKWINIKQELLRYKDNIYVFGYDLIDILQEEKIEELSKINNIYFIKNNQSTANAVNVALIGEKRILEKQYDDIYRLTPFYISKSEAEIKKDRK